MRTVQGPETSDLANDYIRAIRQLHGTLTDASGATIPDESTAGPESGGVTFVDTVNFEKDALPFDVIDADGNCLASFSPIGFPGIPGLNGHTTRFAVEVVGFVELPLGATTFGVSVATIRTDVNDDDGYEVYVGANPRDFLAQRVGQFERQAPAFQAGTHGESQWTVVTTQAGVYPFRITHWQSGRGANLQWYTVNNDTGERILVNDPADERALKAFRNSTVPAGSAPYVAEVAPLPGSSGNPASAPIKVVLADGGTVLADSSVKLSLNAVAVTPQSTRRDGRTYTVSYTPKATRINPNNAVQVTYASTAGNSYTNAWQFTIVPAGNVTFPVTGQWDFDKGDLSATVGAALEYLDGAAGQTASGTQYGTTTSFGISDINGVPARVMRVPGDLSRNIGYIMHHGIALNGGGTKVNQFTLVMDVYVATAGSFAASLLQVSSQSNTDDGDLFWQQGNFGQGGGGYNGQGTFTAGSWHRVVAAYDLAASTPVVVKYVDGIFQDNWTANQSLDAARRALQPTAVLFGDGDQDERREWWVNSVQIRAGRLSNAEIESMGGPSAEGLPVLLSVAAPTPPPSLTITKSGGTVTLSWPVAATGYTLESTANLRNPSWSPVSGVTGNSVTVTASGTVFFRLRK